MAGRRRKGKSDAAGRDEAYNQLNLMLLGAWQLLYNVQNGGKGAAGHIGTNRRAARLAAAQSCLDGCGCRRADRESTGMPHIGACPLAQRSGNVLARLVPILVCFDDGHDAVAVWTLLPALTGSCIGLRPVGVNRGKIEDSEKCGSPPLIVST